MPTEETKRVAKYRKEYFDRVSVLIDKGGKHLLKALAIREGISIAEVIRRSICARAGLKALPYPDELNKLASIDNKEDADNAIIALQIKQMGDDVTAKTIDSISEIPDKSMFMVQLSGMEIEELNRFINESNSQGYDRPISGREIFAVRRILSNLKRVEDNE